LAYLAYLTYLGLFGLIWLIWAYLGLFELIWAYLGLIGSFDLFQLAVPAKYECAHLSESYFKLISMQRIIEACQIQD
jgi:hypothetical protein